jgi:prophage antirepressor-like protein
MNELITIKGVRGYVDKNGTTQLNLEDVARGLGFTTVATSGNECVRWSRVSEYLIELGFTALIENDTYIPENIFYRLAMKAKNETAEKFQAIVADEILPSIRKHGAYMTPDTIDKVINDPDFGIRLLTVLKEARERNHILSSENQLLAQQNVKWTNRKVLESVVKMYGSHICRNFPMLNGYQEAWREFKKELLYMHSINLNLRITNYMDNSGKKTAPKTLDMIHDEELSECISTAVAMCRNHNVDISEIIEKYQSPAMQ